MDPRQDSKGVTVRRPANKTTPAEEEFLQAAFTGDNAKISDLLKDGVSVDVTSSKPGREGLTALHLACWSGKDDVVKLLLFFQAKRKAVGKGMKPVHFAAKGGHVNVLSVLWNNECNIKSKSLKGRSPLHVAADNGNFEAVKWLVEKGSYLNAKDVRGKTPEDLAKDAGYKDVARYLREKAEELKLDGITGMRKLGEGAFGEVYLVKKDLRYSVLKQINLAELERRKQEYAHQEIKLLKSLTHPYIVSYLGGGFKGKYLYIEMEYCSGGDLYTRICDQKDKKIPFEETLLVNWSLRLSLALKYVHSRNILHRDLKPHNIFLTDNGVIKLGDFGLAKALEDSSAATTYLGSPAYMSPELLQGNPYDSATDMWSFGCVMFELAALKLAFPYKNLELPSSFSRGYNDVIKALLVDDPKKRPKAADILRLPLFLNALESQMEEKEHQVAELNQEVEDLSCEVENLTREIQKRDEIIRNLQGKKTPS